MPFWPRSDILVLALAWALEEVPQGQRDLEVALGCDLTPGGVLVEGRRQTLRRTEATKPSAAGRCRRQVKQAKKAPNRGGQTEPAATVTLN